MTQIWSMKKNEDAAAKKKPKTSAAQIRVQKGQLTTPADGASARARVAARRGRDGRDARATAIGATGRAADCCDDSRSLARCRADGQRRR